MDESTLRRSERFGEVAAARVRNALRMRRKVRLLPASGAEVLAFLGVNGAEVEERRAVNVL